MHGGVLHRSVTDITGTGNGEFDNDVAMKVGIFIEFFLVSVANAI